MINVLRLLFWLWLFGSLGILAVRTMNKRSGAVATPTNGKLSAWDSLLGRRLAEEPTSTATLPMGLAPPFPERTATPPSTRPGGDPTSPVAGPTATAGEPVRPDPPGALDDTDGRRGLFASGPPAEPSPPAASAEPARTVADALHGLAWPCGLTPVIKLADQHLADRQVTFSTTEAAAAEVGRRLGDALEALGYALRSLSDTMVEARRSDAVVEVRIHPEAGSADGGGQPLFPALPPGAVVVVFTLRST